MCAPHDMISLENITFNLKKKTSLQGSWRKPYKLVTLFNIMGM